jgi:hypothetical protein
MRESTWVDLCLACAFCAAIVLNAPLSAHHSFAAEFDDTKPVKVTGTITNVEWKNPHIWFYVDVKNPDGTVTNWGFAGGAPGQLMRRGIMKDQLKLGETIVVEGFRAKDGSFNASGGRVTFPDGRNVLTASPQDRQPGEAPKP